MPSVMRSPRRPEQVAGVLLFQIALLIACGSRDERATPASAARPASHAAAKPSADGARPSAPPAVAFAEPQPWQSAREGTEPIAPPPLETWRALVSQHKPHQIETPRWQPLPPKDTVALKMAPGSALRCVVTPLQMTADANDFGTKLKAWVLTRSLLCSGDRFRSWTEHVHSVRVPTEGSRATTAEAAVLLRERDAGAEVRHAFVSVRDDEERRAATTGPPRILPGVAVDED